MEDEAQRQVDKMLEGGGEEVQEALLFDETYGRRRRKMARREVAALEEEGSDVLGHREQLEGARQELRFAEEDLERHWEAKDSLMDATEKSVWGKGIDVEQTIIDTVTEKLLRVRALERRIELGGWDGDEDDNERDARYELRWLKRKSVLATAGPRGSIDGNRHDLEMVFRLLDSDGSGDLSAKELQDHISSLGLGKTLYSEASRMMSIADADGDCYVTKGTQDALGEDVKGRDVIVEMEDVTETGKDGSAINRGRRAKRILCAVPDKGEEPVLWERSWEEQTHDPRQPSYMERLVQLMGSANPKMWTKSSGSGAVDLKEFLSMFVSTEDESDEDDDEYLEASPSKADTKSRAASSSAEGLLKESVALFDAKSKNKADVRPSKDIHRGAGRGSSVDGEADHSSSTLPTATPLMTAITTWDIENVARLSPLEKMLAQIHDGSCGDTLRLDALLFTRSNLGKIADRSEWLSGLADALQSNVGITSLAVTRINLNHEEVRELCSSIKNSRLRHLSLLENWDIGASGCIAACKELTACVRLETLDISGCSVEDEGVEAVASILIGKARLQSLAMRNCRISDVGATHIARALSRDSYLSTLDLTHNLIGNSGCKALQECMLECNASNNQVSSSNTSIISLLVELNPISAGEFIPSHMCRHPRVLCGRFFTSSDMRLSRAGDKARLQTLTSDHGIALRQSLKATYDPLTSFARWALPATRARMLHS